MESPDQTPQTVTAHETVEGAKQFCPRETFIAQHGNLFFSMQAAAKQMTHQLPNEHGRVACVLDAIQCKDSGLQAAMASIKTDQAANGLQNNFEAALSICYHVTRCRRRELIMQEASVVLLLVSQMQPARMQTFHLILEPRKAPDPVEFPFNTTPKQSVTCQTREGRMSFSSGDKLKGQKEEKKKKLRARKESCCLCC
jgi:hypothetical protein